jgi:hypothetical protein
MQATETKKTLRMLAASVLAHPEKCRVSAQTASCGHMKNALTAVPNVFASIASLVGLEYFVWNENVYCYWQAIVILSYLSF